LQERMVLSPLQRVGSGAYDRAAFPKAADADSQARRRDPRAPGEQRARCMEKPVPQTTKYARPLRSDTPRQASPQLKGDWDTRNRPFTGRNSANADRSLPGRSTSNRLIGYALVETQRSSTPEDLVRPRLKITPAGRVV